MRVVIGIALSAALILWMVFSTDWTLVGNELARFQILALVPVILVFTAHYFLRALRWRYLLPTSDAPPTLRQLLDSLMIGNLATYLLPMRAGEIIRPLFLLRYSNYTFSTAFVSVIVERFFDLSVVLISFGLVMQHVSGVPEWVGKGANILSLVALAIFMGILAASFAPKLVIRISGLITNKLPSNLGRFAERFILDFIHGAAVLARPRNLVYVVLLSIAVWGSCFFLFHVFFWMFGIETKFMVAIVLTVVVALAVAAPSAPGFLGVYQTACIASFALFEMKEELAVAYSIITHLIHYIVFISYGFWVLSREKISLRDLRTKPPRHEPCS